MSHNDIFLSYSSQDSEYVDLLQKSLIKRGYRVWYDRTHISWGDGLKNEIEEGLRNSYYGIVVLSHHYLAKKRWTTIEFDHLKDGRIFPLLYRVTIDEIKTEHPDIHEHIGEIRVISSDPGLDYVLNEVDQVIGSSIVGQRPEFTRLRNLLAAREWEYADVETFNLVNQKGGILGIPHEDLNNLDSLWFIYSDQHYGFRIQQEIYQECDQSNRDREHLQSYYRFCERVEWSRGGPSVDYSPHPDTPRGHFPALAYFRHNLKGQAPLTKTGVKQAIARDTAILFCIGMLVFFAGFIFIFVYFFHIDQPQLGSGITFLYILFSLVVCVVVVPLWAKSRTCQRARNLHKFFTSNTFNL